MKISTTPLMSSVHSLEDYRRMFSLEEGDLHRSILDYPGGLSSFNAEMNTLGHRVVSADEHYAYSYGAMQKFAKEKLRLLHRSLEEHTGSMVAETSEVLEAWQYCAEHFLADYEQGSLAGRYKPASMPHLPFADGEFELALCADLSLHDTDAGLGKPALMNELCRVAEEVRVFPLLDQAGDVENDLGPILLALQEANFGVEVREVPYRFLRGSNAMLRVWAKECVVTTK